MKQCKPNPWLDLQKNYKIGSEVEGEVKSITEFGLFIGLHNNIMEDKHANRIQGIFDTFEWKEKNHILVTGGTGMVGKTLQKLTKAYTNLRMRKTPIRT